MDQSLFAAPHGLSQRTTSFIASCRQGIHQTPFWHLIVPVIDARQCAFPLGRKRRQAPTGRSDLTLESDASNHQPFAGMSDASDFPLYSRCQRAFKRHSASKAQIYCLLALLVEPDGIEPTTSCLQSRRSTN